jgi:sulfonate dioxygenase
MRLLQSRRSLAWKRPTVRFPSHRDRSPPTLTLPQTVVYSTSSPRSNPFPSLDLWHSDVSYELQPPSTTSLKLLTGPEAGGDTLWSSSYALYSSLSPGLQLYLEGLSALHSAVAQADGARAAGIPVRREPIETVHPVIRVHPTTGWKSVYVNPGGCSLISQKPSIHDHLPTSPDPHCRLIPQPHLGILGFTRQIVGVPKAESDAILGFLFSQIGQNHDFQVRLKWEPNDVAIWDNRVCFHFSCFLLSISPRRKFLRHLGRDTLRHVRLLASHTSRSARHAARRASDLRRGLRAHDWKARARSSA